MRTLWFAFLIVGVASTVAAPLPSDGRESSQPFKITISAPKEVLAGDVVPLSILLTNTSDHDMLGSVTYGNGVWLAFDYSVTRLDGGMPRPLQPHFPAVLVGSVVGPSKTQAGKTQSGTSLLDRIFDMPAGKYSVKISRSALDASGHATGEVVSSNTITITIVPPPFAIEISTPNPQQKAGSPVPLDVRLTNNSDAEMQFGAPPAPPALDRHFVYVCRRGQKDVAVPLLASQDSQPFFTLKPGGTHDEQVSLNSACDLSQPGEYTVRVWRYDPRGASRGSVMSNEITLVVKP